MITFYRHFFTIFLCSWRTCTLTSIATLRELTKNFLVASDARTDLLCDNMSVLYVCSLLYLIFSIFFANLFLKTTLTKPISHTIPYCLSAALPHKELTQAHNVISVSAIFLFLRRAAAKSTTHWFLVGNVISHLRLWMTHTPKLLRLST